MLITWIHQNGQYRKKRKVNDNKVCSFLSCFTIIIKIGGSWFYLSMWFLSRIKQFEKSLFKTMKDGILDTSERSWVYTTNIINRKEILNANKGSWSMDRTSSLMQNTILWTVYTPTFLISHNVFLSIIFSSNFLEPLLPVSPQRKCSCCV